MTSDRLTLPYCLPNPRTPSTAWCEGHNRYLRTCHAEAAEAAAAERERIIKAMEREGIVTWGDDEHRIRFLNAMKDPTKECEHTGWCACKRHARHPRVL